MIFGVHTFRFAGLFGSILSHNGENTRTAPTVCSAGAVTCLMSAAHFLPVGKPPSPRPLRQESVISSRRMLRFRPMRRNCFSKGSCCVVTYFDHISALGFQGKVFIKGGYTIDVCRQRCYDKRKPENNRQFRRHSGRCKEPGGCTVKGTGKIC